MKLLNNSLSSITMPARLLIGRDVELPLVLRNAVSQSVAIEIVERQSEVICESDAGNVLEILVPGDDPEFWNWVAGRASGQNSAPLEVVVAGDGSSFDDRVVIPLSADDPDGQLRTLNAVLDIFTFDGLMSHSRSDAIEMLNQAGFELRSYDFPVATKADLAPLLRCFMSETASLERKAIFVMNRGGFELTNELMSCFDEEVFDWCPDLKTDLQVRDPREGESLGLNLLLLSRQKLYSEAAISGA